MNKIPTLKEITASYGLLKLKQDPTPLDLSEWPPRVKTPDHISNTSTSKGMLNEIKGNTQVTKRWSIQSDLRMRGVQKNSNRLGNP